MGAYFDELAAARAARKARFDAAAARAPESSSSSESALAAGMNANNLLSRRLDESAAALLNIQKRLDAIERRLATIVDALPRIEANENDGGRKPTPAVAPAWPDARVSARDVKYVVGRAYGVSFPELEGTSRIDAVVRARHIAMYLTRELAMLSYSEIGALFGGRDHSTALYAWKTVARFRAADTRVDAEIAALAAQIRR
jgi:chromosomal replication initiation ATPase DnaA